MDYGKIAYHKAEDLERQVSAGRFAAQTVVAGITGTGNAAAAAEMRGKGLLVARVESTGSVKIYAGSEEIASGAGDYTAAVAAGNCTVGVLAPAGTTTKVTLTAAGWGVSLKPAD